MKAILTALCCLTIAPWSAFAQVRAKQADTSLRLEIEGRGNVMIRLEREKAPKTTAHIIGLVKNGFYDGLRFHRVEKSPKPYLVQVGDPQTKTMSMDDPRVGTGGSGSRIQYEETGLPNVEGAVGLARNMDDPNSGDSQFYIVIGPSRFLDGRYTVFGKVTSGLDVVKNIQVGDRIASASIQGG